MVPFAHALVSRSDLPLPLWLFGWGAAIVLVVSFFALSASWREPKFEDGNWKPIAPRFSRVLLSWPVLASCGLLGVFLLGVVIYAGLEGTDAPDRNFALTFVFVTVWLGFPVASVALGDIFKAFSPWRFVGKVTGRLASQLTRGEAPHFKYPEKLGRWPAAVGLVAFVWLEVVYGSAGASVTLSPEVVSQAVILYSVYTLTMMVIFGVDKWNSRGEFFSVYFNMFSQLSAFEVRNRVLGKRRLLSGAASWATAPGSLAMVVSAIGVTTFDGAQEGAFQGGIERLQSWLTDLGFGITATVRGADTVFLLLSIGLVASIYLAGIWGMRRLPESPSFVTLRSKFAHTLIPIALAYLVAHYFSLFVFQEQAQFSFLLSDPLGDGSDLFGTAGSGINYNVLGATTIWYVQIVALVLGHVVALVLAHDRAVFIWTDHRIAARSQYWMLTVMIAFTSLGLYLLSAGNK